jgi:NAD(P) transhydrogenase
MSVETFDLVVIGSGPAGEKGAAQAAYFGKRVALVEKEPHLGGAGINTGTIPSKTLRETALYLSGILQRGLYGVDYSIKGDITIPEFMHRKDEVVRNLWRTVEANIHRHRIELVRGRASFEDPRAIRVAAADRPDRILSAPVILVATGSYPNWPDRVLHDPRLYDSDSILRMERLPRSLLVVGGGVIGCEYATIFRALGIEVRLLGGQDRLLPFLDAEISERLRLQMELMGLDVVLGDGMAEVELGAKEVAVVLKSGRVVEAEAVLFATGRMGAIRGLALERAGLTAGRRGHLEVNAHYQTAVPHIYAAGDVVGFPALASTSMEQARVAMCHAFDLKYKERVSPVLPMAVYTIPEIGTVGETEESCREKKIPYFVGRALYSGNSRGQIIGDMSGLVKLVFSCEDRRVLGVHVLGEMASELIHLGQSWLLFKGTIDNLIDSVFNYPTLGEAYKYAAYDGLGNLAKLAASPPGDKPE